MAYGIIKNPRTQRIIDQEGSPVFPFTMAVLAAGASVVIDPTVTVDRRARTYAPMDEVRIVNNSTELLRLRWNGRRRTEFIPGGTIWTFDRQACHQLTVTNLDGVNATAADEVHLQFQRMAKNADDVGKRYG